MKLVTENSRLSLDSAMNLEFINVDICKERKTKLKLKARMKTNKNTKKGRKGEQQQPGL